MPLFVGQAQTSFWHKVMKKLKNKMVGWKGVLLSMGGKIQHAKASLQSILVYMASIYKIPTLVVEKIDQI